MKNNLQTAMIVIYKDFFYRFICTNLNMDRMNRSSNFKSLSFESSNVPKLFAQYYCLLVPGYCLKIGYY